jgi:hypothetical protein
VPWLLPVAVSAEDELMIPSDACAVSALLPEPSRLVRVGIQLLLSFSFATRISVSLSPGGGETGLGFK